MNVLPRSWFEWRFGSCSCWDGWTPSFEACTPSCRSPSGCIRHLQRIDGDVSWNGIPSSEYPSQEMKTSPKVMFLGRLALHSHYGSRRGKSKYSWLKWIVIGSVTTDSDSWDDGASSGSAHALHLRDFPMRRIVERNVVDTPRGRTSRIGCSRRRAPWWRSGGFRRRPSSLPRQEQRERNLTELLVLIELQGKWRRGICRRGRLYSWQGSEGEEEDGRTTAVEKRCFSDGKNDESREYLA